MSTTAKASDHVKPCNIAQSERHNRRDADYIKSLNPAKLYIRVDLSENNTSYVAPEMKGRTLQQHYDSIREMVKQKTNRAMQEKDVEYKDKNGKVRVRKGCSPIRESVANIKEDTTLEDLLRYARMVEDRWGIKAIQIHLHKDEGHYETSGDALSWKPNYHAHIIWDWMNHETGKSFKLDADDMSEMQDMVAEALDMERGQKKSETGLDHLERNDFIIQKQENEKKRIEAEKKRLLDEKDEAKLETLIAIGKRNEAEDKAIEARRALDRMESLTTEKQTKIDQLEQNIDIKRSTLEQIRSEAIEQRKELFTLKADKDWKMQALYAISVYLVAVDDAIKYCVNAIVDYAYSGSGGRGGKHGDFFYDEESSTIKKLMKTMAEYAKVPLRVIGNWLVWIANSVGQFNDWELHRAETEVKDIAEGRYDGRIQKYENGRDNSMRI